jgi:predicted alpha/beta-fold hydrolase
MVSFIEITNLLSDRFVGSINIPFLVLHANDDPIAMTKYIPKTDLMRNPNAMLIETNTGGHCDFFMRAPGKKFDYQRVSGMNPNDLI